MSTKKQKKGKSKPVPKSNLDAMLPRPKPVAWGNPQDTLNDARQHPILGCWIDRGWQEVGLARVVVAREQAPGQVLYSLFLVDYYCLGIKDCEWKSGISQNSFQKRLQNMLEDPQPCEPSLAHQLIYGAVTYAERYGFKPHQEFKAASLILDPPGTYPARHDIQFGHNGKPLYIAGPYDKTEWVISTLMRTAGEGNFDFVTPLG